MNIDLTGRTIQARNADGKKITGKIVLIYADAIASGTNQYVPVTMLLVVDEENDIQEIRPRDIIKFA